MLIISGLYTTRLYKASRERDMLKARSLFILCTIVGIGVFSLTFFIFSIAVDNCGFSGLELTLYKVLCLVALPAVAGLAISSYILKLLW